MDKQKLTLIIIGLVVILGFLSLMVVLLQMKKNVPSGEKEDKSNPTAYRAVENIFKVPTVTLCFLPTEIPAASQYCALDEQLPPAIQDLATQKQELKSKPTHQHNAKLCFSF
jgi:flagellar basal body-associated protein FliL